MLKTRLTANYSRLGETQQSAGTGRQVRNNRGTASDASKEYKRWRYKEEKQWEQAKTKGATGLKYR